MKIYLTYILTLLSTILRTECVLYDRFSGEKVHDARMKELQLANTTKTCTIDIRPCTPHEGSRIDGSCNNFKYPSLGTAKGPYARLLIPDFSENGDIKRSKEGKALPSARLVRTSLQSTGRVTDKTVFNVAALHFLDFINKDMTVLFKPVEYLKEQDCCHPTKQPDPRCRPIEVPEGDPYLKVTGIRCLNFSRAETFQDVNCLSKSMLPEHINLQTPMIDLSTIYGVDENSMNLARKWEDGLLVMEERNGRDVPVANISDNLCIQNAENETNCYNFGFPEVGNFDLRTTGFTIFFMREHNRLAKNLHKLNPCWKDDRVFKVARQINIGTAVNIFMYELLPGLLVPFSEHNINLKILEKMGRIVFHRRDAEMTSLLLNFFSSYDMVELKRRPLSTIIRYDGHDQKEEEFFLHNFNFFKSHQNMVNYGLLSSGKLYISVYDEGSLPLVFAEYEIAIRFFRTLIDGRIKKYDSKYNYVGELSYSDNLLRQAVLEKDDNFEDINRGTFYQNAGKIDDIQDPEISERYFGNLQKAYDQAASDIQRGRDLGMRGYNDYRQICGLKTAKTFEDFADVIDIEKVEVLRRLYDDVDDVDLLAGIISENYIKNTFVGPTLFCIIARQMNVYRLGDRFWFERGDQFHSFSVRQLQEIRKTNLARLACDNAEGIEYIQPQAFFNVRTGNMPVFCSYISGADLTKWRDQSCYKDDTDSKTNRMTGRVQSDEFLSMYNNNLLSFKPNFAIS